ASVRSLTTGTAAGGDVTVRVFGSAVMNGPGASGTGIFTSSQLVPDAGSPIRAGPAGNVTVAAGSLRMNSANIGTLSAGNGESGGVSVKLSGTVFIDGGGSSAFGISAEPSDQALQGSNLT